MKNVTHTRRFCILTLFLLVSSVCMTEAAITSTGDVTPAFSGPGIPAWSPLSDLTIGNTGPGTLTLDALSQIINSPASRVYLGFTRTGSGRVTLNTLTPIAIPSWDIDSTLFAGVAGDSQIDIIQGNLTTRELLGGLYGTSTSTINVTGAGSSLIVEERWTIGEYGDGFVTISGGAAATANETYIGRKDALIVILDAIAVQVFPDANGIYPSQEEQEAYIKGRMGEDVTVEPFTPRDPTNPGRQIVTLPEGTLLSSEFVGDWTDPGDPNALTVSGSLFTRKSNPSFTDSVFDAIDPRLHAVARVVFNTNVVAEPNDYRSDSRLTVADPGSVFTTVETLFIGGTENLNQGTGQLLVRNGGVANSKNAYLARGSEGVADVNVTGTGSAWHNSEGIYVGEGGQGTLQISQAGLVTSQDAYLGFDSNGVGRVSVSGEGSRLQINNAFYVGYLGGGTLTIEDRATVSAFDFSVGFDPCETGTGAATVENATLSVGNWLKVGSKLGSTFGVKNGGRVTTDQFGAGHDPKHLARVNISGAGSTFVTTNLYVGEVGNALFTVGPDANVVADYARIGQGAPIPLPDLEPFLNLGRGFSGVLDVNGGVFQARQLDIAPNGLLRGNGDIISDQVTSRGTIEPGNSIGAMTVHGDLSLESGSQLNIEVDNKGNSDQLIVTGTTTINGGTVKTFSSETITASRQYTIIRSNEITGPGFDAIDTLDSAFLSIGVKNISSTASLQYGQNSVVLDVTVVPFTHPTVTDTPNRRELGDALQQAVVDGGNQITAALQQIRSQEQVGRFYDQLSGQSRTSLTTITSEGATRLTGAVSGRLHHARGGFARASDHSPKFAMAGPDPFYNRLFYDTNPFQALEPIGQKEPDTEWGYWGKFFGAFGDREAVKGFTGYAHSTTGWATGADYQISNHTLVGVTLGMANSSIDYAGSQDSSKIEAQYLGIYTGHNKEFWYVDSVLTLSRLGYTTERIVDITGEQLAGEFNGFEINGYLEGGWDWGEAQGWLVQPMASVQVSFVQLASYTETGGASALAFGEQDMLSIKGSAGLRLTKDVAWTEKHSGKLQVRGRWVHEFGDNSSHVDAHFASNPGATFTVTDEGAAPDSVVIGAGIHTDIGSGDTILLDYDMRVATDESAHILIGQWKHRW